ncbi:MAG TPA: YciI family protein [Paraburkholderia sp.]|jgi:uncharacterized protein YciI|nr:YciI family protein [Paraburkholderia sp.]
MPYMIETWDKPDHQHVRDRVRPTHLEFLAQNASKLLACGAKLNDDGQGAQGSLYVIDVDTRAEAERFIAEDPFTLAELFERVAIVRWRKAFLDGRSYL